MKPICGLTHTKHKQEKKVEQEPLALLWQLHHPASEESKVSSRLRLFLRRVFTGWCFGASVK